MLIRDVPSVYWPARSETSRGSVEVETPGLPAALAEGFDVITLGPLMGAEFSFAGIPEMSVDWELGYRTNLVDIEVADYDISLSMGVLAASVGVHYYFGR